jgi:hypothetical protein
MSAVTPENISAQKELLFLKTLTPEAQDIIIRRMANAGEYLRQDIMFYQLIESVLAAYLAIGTGKGWNEFDIFNWNWSISLPTIEQLLEGQYAIVINIDVNDLFRDFASIEWGYELPEDFVLNFSNMLPFFFLININPQVVYWIIGIGVYGQSHYNYALYFSPNYEQLPPTPWGVVYWPSSVVASVPQLSVNPTVVAQWAEMFGSKLLAEYLALKVDMLEQILLGAFFLSFNMLNLSVFLPKSYFDSVEGIKFSFKQGYKLFIPSIDFLLFGFYLNVSRLGIDRLMNLTDRVMAEAVTKFGYYRGLIQLNLFQSPWSGVLFRKTEVEMENFHIHRSVQRYAVHAYNIQLLVKRLYRKLDSYGINQFDKFKYRLAMLDLVYRLRIGHKRSKEWKTELSDDEFYRMWLSKWETQGLNTSILQEIYGDFITCQKQVLKMK